MDRAHSRSSAVKRSVLAHDPSTMHEHPGEGHYPEVTRLAELMRRERMVVHRHEGLREPVLLVDEQQPELSMGRPFQHQTELVLQIGVGGENAVGIDTRV
jgi:hypothetical protein